MGSKPDPKVSQVADRRKTWISDSNNVIETSRLKPVEEFHPDYYKTDSGLEPWDVIKAFELDYWRGSVVAYLLRAGRKFNENELVDLEKAYTFLAERIRQLKVELGVDTERS
jgi:hypothetical protein